MCLGSVAVATTAQKCIKTHGNVGRTPHFLVSGLVVGGEQLKVIQISFSVNGTSCADNTQLALKYDDLFH